LDLRRVLREAENRKERQKDNAESRRAREHEKIRRRLRSGGWWRGPADEREILI